jgi:hypothetical protein
MPSIFRRVRTEDSEGFPQSKEAWAVEPECFNGRPTDCGETNHSRRVRTPGEVLPPVMLARMVKR